MIRGGGSAPLYCLLGDLWYNCNDFHQVAKVTSGSCQASAKSHIQRLEKTLSVDGRVLPLVCA